MNNKQKVNYDNVKNALLKIKGRTFSCEFIKRTTGEKRKITGRLGVKKFLKNGKQPYNQKDLNLITIYEMPNKNNPAGGYRNISVENILNININGEKYEFA